MRQLGWASATLTAVLVLAGCSSDAATSPRQAGSQISSSSPTVSAIADPLDGTTNFAHGYPQFCISIAFENRGIVMLGLVYDPVHQECFKAVRDGGARLNGATIHVSPLAQLDEALLGTGFPYDRRDRISRPRRTSIPPCASSSARARSSTRA